MKSLSLITLPVYILLACLCGAADIVQTRTTPGFTPSEVDSMAEAAHQTWRDEVLSQTKNRSGKIALREGPLGENWDVSTIDSWMQVYKGQILDPPWEFCVTEPVSYSNNSASNALRSVLHATYKMDYEGLNSLTDDKAIKDSNRYYLQPRTTIEQIQKATFPGLIDAKRITVLLVGHLEWKDDEYVYYLFRGSHAESPQDNQYIFGRMSFRKDQSNNLYWQTDDLKYSSISSYLIISTPHDPHTSKLFGTYQEMYDYYKGSDTPVHFYTFGE